MERTYLDLLDASCPGDMRYLTVFRENQLVGALVFQRVQLQGRHLLPYAALEKQEAGQLSKLAHTLRCVAVPYLSRKRWTLLHSGSPLTAEEPGYLFSPELQPSERQDILLQALELTGRDFGNISGFLTGNGGFELPGFLRLPAEPEMLMSLDLGWKGFDDYLNALQSRYRVRARKVLSASASLHKVELDGQAIRQQESKLLALYQQVADRADFNMATLGEGYFSGMKDRYGSDFRLMAWYGPGQSAENEADVPLGFQSGIYRGAELHSHFIGLNYDRAQDFRLYHAMLYEYISWAIERSSRNLRLGRTAPEIKSSVGAVPIQKSYQYRHRNAVMRAILGPALRLAHIPAWIPRHPFRLSNHNEPHVSKD